MKELIKKLGAFSIGPIIGAAIGFINIPVITRFISPEEYGKSSMFMLAQGTISLIIYLGLDQAFVREFHTYEDKDKLLLNSIMIPMVSVILLDFIASFNIQKISVLLFDVPGENISVIFLMVLLPFMVIQNFALLKIRMEENGLLFSLFTILLKVVTLVLTIVFFFAFEKSYRSVVYSIAVAEIFNGIILYILTLRKISLKNFKPDFALIKKLLHFGLPLIPAALIGWALSSMDKVMLRSMHSYSELGLYSAAFKIVTILGIIQTCFTLFWTPVAYRWYESGQKNESFELVSDTVGFIMVFLCMGVLLFKNVIGFILGKSFTEAIYIFPFLLLIPIMYTMSESTAMGIGFKRKTKYNIVVSAISSGVNILLNYFFIPVMGAKGAALATGISYILFFWTRTIISRNLWWKFPITKYIVYTVLIVINCAVHTFISNGWIPFITSGISMVLIVGLNYNLIIMGINAAKKKSFN